jgi:hypothetical protein
MAECDFVEEHMPKFVGIYRQDEMLGKTWSSSQLKTHISHLASKGQLKTEKEAGQQNIDNEIAANMLRQNHHETTSYGINDDSKHPYDHDQYWVEETVISDGKLRYDTMSEAYGVYGSQSETEREHDEMYHNSKGKAGKGSKGAKGYKGSKGAKGSKGGTWDRGKGGRGAYQNRSPKGRGNWYDRNGGYGRGGRAYGSNGRDSSDKQERDQQQESASPYVPKKKMVCKVCEWAGKPWHVVTNHTRDTCNHPGGDMEGHSRFDCINAQRQRNAQYYEDEKRRRQPPPRISRPESEVKRLKAASDYNREQDKSPERSGNGERQLTNDEVIQRYFGAQMAKITNDGDDETYEARVNQADMDEEEPNEKPIDKTSPM